jgi:hypothetical protein
MIKVLKKLVIEETYLNMIKATYDELSVNTVLNIENQNHFL